MEIRNCKRCGRMFQYINKTVCADCVKKEDEDFEVARAFVKENPGSGIQHVSDETGIEIKLLTKFVREGRIEFADGSSVLLSCESCGIPIPNGRYCNNCLSQLGREMLQNAEKPAAPAPAPAKKESGMHLSKLKK